MSSSSKYLTIIMYGKYLGRDEMAAPDKTLVIAENAQRRRHFIFLWPREAYYRVIIVALLNSMTLVIERSQQ